ncbi:hypothetical protein Ssi02_67310 [Sinosporangium siamense]|uniref:HTH luxR-type domain-containing protein n=1 Tax=Sinosporangium siamense TaxID=1367973 RepID=A0A919RP82_9ACTN|nr:hypothetical protein Ssi02_67310 [Sinosporangium siamense]
MGTAAGCQDPGDLGDGFGTGFDVAHGGAGVLVAGLAHDELQRDFGFAEVGGGAVVQLVQVISAGTAKTHVANVQRKLGVRNRVGIAAWAWEHGHA